MANNYFQFKQFTVYQDKSAMKVCTDACLFGAIVADELKTFSVKNMLDIGTGTGLLSLMVAQKKAAKIDAIEIDEAAFSQATENITQSPWKENIQIIHANILNFNPDKKYDFIFSNPPFYENDLKSEDQRKNFAKHDNSLTLENLLKKISLLLSENGHFAVLLPFSRTNYFENICAAENFHLSKKIKIRQTPKHDYFRSILFFSQTVCNPSEEEIIIKNSEGNYSDEFVELLKDYYLHLEGEL